MFKVAGIASNKGVFKVRFANDMDRVKVLVKHGMQDIEMISLPHDMDKPEAVSFLKTTALMERAEYRAAIETADAKYNGAQVDKPAQPAKAAKTVEVAGVKVKVKAPVKAKASKVAVELPDYDSPVEPTKTAGNWFEQQFAAEIAAEAAAIRDNTKEPETV
jgi:hypothetical protein